MSSSPDLGSARDASRALTMSDVAERAGVSRQLVSMVLRDVPGPSEASRALVLQAAAELDFRPNASARLLRQKRTRLIGAMVAASNVFELQVVERLLERASELGFHVVLGPQTTLRTTDVVLSELLAQRVEALALFNPDPHSAVLERALETLPVVWLGERATDPRADVVRTDDDAGLIQIVEHLVGLGHRDIAYAGGLHEIGASARLGRADGVQRAQSGVGPDRADAYARAMEAAGLGHAVDIVAVGFGEEDGAEAARRLLARDRLPTAVIGGSDQCGAGLRAVFALAGVDVPGDVSVTGYDDSDVAQLSFNALTTIRQDVELTVEATLDSLLRRIEDPALAPRETPTRATLIVRSSTGPARRG